MPVAVSEYERIRLKNIEDNKRILAELGLMNPFGPQRKIISIKKNIKRSRPPSATPAAKKRKVEEESGEGYGSVHGSRRRSARFQGKDPKSTDEIKEDVENAEEDEDYKPRLRVPPGRENSFGAIPGIEVGEMWEMRLECCVDGVHRPTVSGIHGGNEGAYSIAMSGGYEDDIDMGEFFTYTGQGGRDLKGTRAVPKNLRTAPQSKDQTLSHGNLALSKNVTSEHPVRVIRGYKSRSRYAPDWGYRYDGLYSVEKCWFTSGLSGFGVWKFALRRLKDQAPPPWEYDDKVQEEKCSQDSGVVSDQSDAGSVTSDQPSQESVATDAKTEHVQNDSKEELENDEDVIDEKEMESSPEVSSDNEEASDDQKENSKEEEEMDEGDKTEEENTESDKTAESEKEVNNNDVKVESAEPEKTPQAEGVAE